MAVPGLNPIIMACPICGRTFYAAKPDQRHCNDPTCRQAHRRSYMRTWKTHTNPINTTSTRRHFRLPRARTPGAGNRPRTLPWTPVTTEEATWLGITLPTPRAVECLRCGKPFISDDPKHIRICFTCNKINNELIDAGETAITIY